MQRQRQAGFIRNYSSKNIPTFHQEPSEFSYFRPRPARDDAEEFSPYKIDQEGQGELPKLSKRPEVVRPPLPPPLPQGKSRQVRVEERERERAVGQQVHARLKERMVGHEERMVGHEERKERSKEKLQENIGNIRNKIEQLDYALQELKASKPTEKLKLQAKVQRELQAELDSSSSSDSEEVVVNSIPSPKISIERTNQRRESRGEVQQKQLLRLSNERSNSQRENIVTFNSRTSNHPPLQIRDYSSSEEEQGERGEQQEQGEQSSYLPKKEREEAATRPVDRQQAPPQQEARGVYKNRGGVCFDIDTKQFTEPIPQPREQQRQPKKPAKVDKRSEVIRRRETAKAYDRMTRKALFTAYN